VAYGEISFSGTIPKDGTAAEEIAALMKSCATQAGCPNPSRN
jgi:hypothetical protein